jgi:membrane protein DedA with SNARE-associated domain
MTQFRLQTLISLAAFAKRHFFHLFFDRFIPFLRPASKSDAT